MDTYYEDRAVKAGFKLKEDLGSYVAETDHMGLKMKLDVSLVGFDMNNHGGHDEYSANVEFYKKGRENMHIPVVDVKFAYVHNLNSIIRKLKRAEEGIEVLFQDETCSAGYYDWEPTRKVMRCILSLEDKLKPVMESRKELADERRAALK